MLEVSVQGLEKLVSQLQQRQAQMRTDSEGSVLVGFSAAYALFSSMRTSR